jgi:hypothetical protein
MSNVSILLRLSLLRLHMPFAGSILKTLLMALLVVAASNILRPPRNESVDNVLHPGRPIYRIKLHPCPVEDEAVMFLGDIIWKYLYACVSFLSIHSLVHRTITPMRNSSLMSSPIQQVFMTKSGIRCYAQTDRSIYKFNAIQSNVIDRRTELCCNRESH